MSSRRIFIYFCAAALFLVSAWWVDEWITLRPTAPSGGLFIPGEILLPGPHYLQADPAWGAARLGTTGDTLATSGCAVASAAMVLAGYGADTDPGRLNQFLCDMPDGYTPEGWLYWEKAALVDPELAKRILPHYEAAPSHFLIDWNLLRGNPVIVRIRIPGGPSHFLVVCGKRGFDYLVRDPGTPGLAGVTLLKSRGSPIDGLRYYRRP